MSVDVEERDDGIVIAAHNNPPMNYFVGESAAGLGAMLPRWREAHVRVVIITGAIPDRYITHYSVEELVDLAEDRDDLVRRSYDLIYGWHQLLQSLSYLDKPVIAAMTGDTGGGGLELSLNCDIRIMQRGDYLVGFPEASLGILTGTGSQLLERAIGRSRALDFLLRSRYVTLAGALDLGIVNELAADAKARAIEVAERLVTNSAVALTAAKRSSCPGRQPADAGGPAGRGRGVAEDDHHRPGDRGDAQLRRHALRGAATVGARPRSLAGARVRNRQLRAGHRTSPTRGSTSSQGRARATSRERAVVTALRASGRSSVIAESRHAAPTGPD